MAGEEVWTVEDVSKRFNVSSKTVSRWRDRGLVSRRFRFGGRNALGFLRSSVERFVTKHAVQLRGYFPAGWYPSALVAVDDDHLLVANAKGTTVRNPNNMPDPYDPKRKNEYILNVIHGNVCAMRIPKKAELATATQQVLDDNRLTNLNPHTPNPLADISLNAGKITHVFYIIKENRTYDQVLGDLPQGNGDKSLVLFGRDITPNQHALAERFVLLDNLYACGEVSGDGWTWDTQGMADAYVERNIPYHYSNRGRKFDFEGQNNGYITGGFPAKDDDDKPLTTMPSMQAGLPPIPDVASTGHNLWDNAHAAGVSLRNYGFLLSFNDRITGLAFDPDNYPAPPAYNPPATTSPALPTPTTAASISNTPTAMPPSTSPNKPLTPPSSSN